MLDAVNVARDAVANLGNAQTRKNKMKVRKEVMDIALKLEQELQEEEKRCEQSSLQSSKPSILNIEVTFQHINKGAASFLGKPCDTVVQTFRKIK